MKIFFELIEKYDFINLAVPDNYTQCVSDTQRYKMLGNGWTVDVIAHIFGSLFKMTHNLRLGAIRT